MSVLKLGDVDTVKGVFQTFAEADEVWLQSRSLLSDHSSPQLAIAHLKLFCPELVSYREGWFLASGFDEAAADVWFSQPNVSVSGVEAILNHLHLSYMFGDTEVVRMTDDEAIAFGQLLSFQWKIWAQNVYSLHIETYLSTIPGDVQIWFESRGVFGND
ncbi:hypothetical protein [Asticcacaulis sp. W401b]|uniref:hypothetical protein n=1 Tax=Asticcacaulis sp. W401b TaxID=3388666 RepID=UPI003970F59B